MTQMTLTGLGAKSGVEKFEPYAHGDIIVTHKGLRYVVLQVSDNVDGGVFVCVNLTTGNDAVILEREIAYRSRG